VLQTVERARKNDGTAVETPWLYPYESYETRNTHFLFQNWRRQSSGAWEKGEALGLIHRMLAWRGSSALRREKLDLMSLCQSPHCSDEHAELQGRGGENFLSRYWRRTTGAVRWHCLLYVTDTLTDMRCYEESGNVPMAGIAFAGLNLEGYGSGG
jgi:hypothetical protein